MTGTIDSFTGEYNFLSNFFPCQIDMDGEIYPSVEHAFQAAKTNDLEIRKKFTVGTPGQAKKLGRTVVLRKYWDLIRLSVMYRLVKQKFSREPLKYWLLQTKDAELVEGNTWNDKFWGECEFVGKNWLGHILMLIRSDLMEENDEKSS